MNREWMERYCRQIALPEIDVAGQERLQAARVLIVGAGGLGSTAALLLAGAGCGNLELLDPDTVALSNLHRQIGHTCAFLDKPKVHSLRDAIQARFPDINVITTAQALPTALSELDAALQASLRSADLVLDCTDNFPTRFVLNALCWSAEKPLVSASAVRWEGQLISIDPRRPDSPCYGCLYPERVGDESESCLSQGVLGPVPAVLGSMQAVEACRVLLSAGDSLVGRLMLFDALRFSFRILRLPIDPACSVCSKTRC
ncbi:MAG: HesA/MoeB/ThiF family protein [Gammaproteobacteria bacterium]